MYVSSRLVFNLQSLYLLADEANRAGKWRGRPRTPQGGVRQGRAWALGCNGNAHARAVALGLPQLLLELGHALVRCRPGTART